MARSRQFIRSVAVPLAVLAGWCAVSKLGLTDPIILPSPASVGRAIFTLILSQSFLADVFHTVGRVAGAVTIAAVSGIPMGLYLGYRREVYAFVEGPIHALRSVPASALFPLLLLVVGVGNSAIVALATYPSLLVILVNVVSGARRANIRRIYQAEILGLSPFRKLRDVLFYEALPQIFDGVRTAVSYSLVLVIAVEMFIGAGDKGLGRCIYDYQSAYRIPETYASIVLAGCIGILLNQGLSMLERRSLRWIPHTREGFDAATSDG